MLSSSPDVLSSKMPRDLRSYGDAGHVDGCDLGFGGECEFHHRIGPADTLG